MAKQSDNHVNRAFINQLLANARLELSLIPQAQTALIINEDKHLSDALYHPLFGPPDFHVRLKWPPDLVRPTSGRLFLIQPWEFGRIPKDWVTPIQNHVDELWAPTTYVKHCFVDSGIDAKRIQP